MRPFARGVLSTLSRQFRTATALIPVGMLSTLAPAAAQSPGNVITLDGRTATQMNVNGHVTDITTNTTRGSNAYNSFSRFQVGEQNTVNLHVPAQSKTLINIVRDGPAVVDGTLNGYKNGKIGGNIVFSDSQGFIVGKNGQINVNSLKVVTPTREFQDSIIDRKGVVNEAAANRLLKGEVPISSDGSVVIRGRINARHSVSINANDVTVASPEIRAERHRARFSATVNTSSLSEGGSVVVRNGKISIVAAGNVEVGGKLRSGGGQAGGRISVTAGGSLKVTESAQIHAGAAGSVAARSRRSPADAAPPQRQGAVNLAATRDLSVAGRVTAAGHASAGGTVQIGAGGTLEVARGAEIRATSVASKSDGALKPGGAVDAATPTFAAISLTSKADIKVAGGLVASGVAGGRGGTITVRNQAGDITLSPTAVLDVSGRGENASAGEIVVFGGRNLTVAEGSRIDASADTKGDGGFVELSATRTVEIQGRLDLDLRARNGIAGRLLIDPDDVVIGPLAGATQGSVDFNGSNATIEAKNSITLQTGGYIDTRNISPSTGASIGNSGSVTLTAPSITLNAGSWIDTKAVNRSGTAYKDGDVTLNATLPTAFGASFLNSTNAASLTIAGAGTGTAGASVQGGTINLNAIADKGIAVDNTFDGLNTATLTIGKGATITGSSDVTALAQADSKRPFDGKSIARAVVDVAGTLRSGGALTVKADGKAVADYDIGLAGAPVFAAKALLSGALGVNGGYVGADNTATVTIRRDATLSSIKDLSILANGKQQASALVVTAVENGAVGVGALMSEIKGTVSSTIESGAQLSSNGTLNIKAIADNTSSAKVMVNSKGTTPAIIGISVALADVNTEVSVASGAVISRAGNVNVVAANRNAFKADAGGSAFDQGVFAFNLAYSDLNTNAQAKFGADLPSTAAVHHLSVLADSTTSQLISTSNASVGNGFVAAITKPLLTLPALPAQTIKGKISESLGAGFDSVDASSKGAISLSFGSGTQSATAAITGVGGAAPMIVTTGDVSVLANAVIARGVADSGLRSNASATIENTDKLPSGGDDPSVTLNAVSLALALGSYENKANAYIGSNSSVTASHIGVRAETSLPIQNVWAVGEGVEGIIANLAGKANSNFGIGTQILTTFANATAAGDKVGIGASVNVLNYSNDTVAWIGSGAKLTQTADVSTMFTMGGSTSTIRPWTVAYNADYNKLSESELNDTGNPPRPVLRMDWTQGTVVQALNRTETINVGGNFSFLTFFGNKGGTKEAGSVGGSANVLLASGRTIAGIADGAEVSARGHLAVDAHATDVTFAVSPTSGKGGGTTINGLVAISIIDNETSASISNNAKISSPRVDVTADQELSIITAAATLGAAQTAALGIGVGVVLVDTDTRAYVGDNSAALAGSDFKAIEAGAGKGVVGTGYLHADRVDVVGVTAGRVVVVGVAGSLTYNDGKSSEDKPRAPKDERSITQKVKDVPKQIKVKVLEGASTVGGGLKAAGSTLKAAAAWVKFQASASDLEKMTAQVKNYIADAKKAQEAGNTPTFSLAGSAAVSKFDMDTAAEISGARLDRYTSSGKATTNVSALNNTLMASAAGAAGISISKGDSGGSAAIAGALAVTLSDNATRARVVATAIDNAGPTAVTALTDGQQVSVGLGLAVTTSQNQNSAAVSISASVTLNTDSATALIDNATIRAADGSSDSINVEAYRSTDIGTGGGSFYGGGRGGLGVALTYAEIGNPTGGDCAGSATCAKVIDTTIRGMVNPTGFSNLTVAARDVGRIISAAAVGGGGPDSNGFGGAVVVSRIVSGSVALIDADGARDEDKRTIAVGGKVTLASESAPNSVLAAELARIAPQSTNSAAAADGIYDFTAAAAQTSGRPGAMIVSVAGLVQVGKNNFGVSILVNEIGREHGARIGGGAIVAAGGDVAVKASDGAEIIGVALGVGGATDKFAGTASVAVSRINNDINAAIGDGTGLAFATRVSGTTVSVDATDFAKIRSGAGGLAFSSGNAALGLGVSYNEVGNEVSARIQRATVTARNDVLLRADASADIVTVALGAAVSQNAGVAGSVATSLEKTNVRAAISDGADVDAQNNALVRATNSEAIAVVAGGVGVAFTDGVGAGLSVVTNVITGETTSEISGSGTKVDARARGAGTLSVDSGTLNNAVRLTGAPQIQPPDLSEKQTTVHGLAVSARASQSVVTNAISVGLSFGVNGGGVAVTPVTNVMSGRTAATIDDAGVMTRLRVTADTAGSTPPDLSLIASNHGTANNFVVAGAGGSLGSGSVAASINVMSRTTDAHIRNATVGTVADAVLPSGYTNDGTSVDADAAPAGANPGNGLSRTTALLGRVSVLGASTQDAADTVIGVSGSGFGSVTGSVVVNTLKADTFGTVSGGQLVARQLDVAATSVNTHGSYIGAAAGAAVAGAGGFSVNISEGRTVARVGVDPDDASQTGRTAVALGGAMKVIATSNDDFKAYVVGLSGGGTAIAAMVSVEVASAVTRAQVNRTDLNRSLTGGNLASFGSAGDVTVSTAQNLTIAPVVGSAAGGGGDGYGAGVVVAVLRGTASGEIINSSLASSGTVGVSATGIKDVDTKAVTAGIGGTQGMAAAVAVVLAGRAADADALREIDSGKNSDGSTASSGTLTAVNNATNIRFGSFRAQGSANDPSQALPGFYAGTQTSSDQNRVLNAVKSAAQDTVTARADASVIDAAALNVGATGQVRTSSHIAGFGGGGTLGVGAAIGFTKVYGTVLASIDGGTVNAGSVSVTADAGDKANGKTAAVGAYAGAGGLSGAAGAAVAIGQIESTVSATLGGTVRGGTTGTATVRATDTSSGQTRAVGASIAGGAALGVSAATIKKNSLIAATLTPDANISGFNAAALTAAGSGKLESQAIAGAGGLFAAGTGAGATSDDESVVIAEAGRQAFNAATNVGAPTAAPTVSLGSGGLTITATATPEVNANAVGVAVSPAGGGVGASVALARAKPTVKAQFDDLARITGGGLDISARVLLPGSGTSAYGEANGGSGGLYLGAQATYIEAKTEATVLARIGNNVVLPNGNVSAVSSTTTRQNAVSTSVAVGSLAVGVAVTKAISDNDTQTQIGTSVTSDQNRTGSFLATAGGTDTNVASATAGAGGLVSGSGAEASTNGTSTATDTVGENSKIYANTIGLSASHEAQYAGHTNSVNAAALNASASVTRNDVVSTVGVTVGNGVRLDAKAIGLGDCVTTTCSPAVDVVAMNTFRSVNPGNSAEAGAGGVLTGSASQVETNINRSGGGTRVAFGNDAQVYSGFDPGATPGSLRVLAANQLFATDVVTLTTGGLIQGAGVNAALRGTLDGTVTIGTRADFFTAGALDIGTTANVVVNQSSNVTTWGLAAVGVANATADITSNQTVTLADGASSSNKSRFVGLYDVNINAGRSALSAVSDTSLSVNASAQGAVRGLIAVPSANATGRIASNATLGVGNNVDIRSARDVYLGSHTGVTSAEADGTGRGYQLGFIPVTSTNSSKPVEKNSTVTMNGTATAGFFNNLQLLFSQVNGDYFVNGSRLTPAASDSPFYDTKIEQENGAPVYLRLVRNFDPTRWINGSIPGASSDNQAARDNAINGIVSGATPAIRISSQLYAAGGTVTLHADNLSGNGTLTAKGSPTINVQNPTSAYLVLDGGAMIPDRPSGSVYFTGGASRGGLIVNEERGSGNSSITLNNSLRETVGDSNFGPALFVGGSVTNLGGAIRISNALGSYAATGNVSGQSVDISTPNGTVTISPNGAGGIYNSGGSPMSEWGSAITYPGGKRGSSGANAEEAIHYLGNAIFRRGSYAGYGLNAVDGVNESERLNVALYGRNSRRDQSALVLFGNFAPFGGGSGNPGGSGSATGGYLLTTDANKTSAYFPKVQSRNLTLTQDQSAANFAGSNASAAVLGASVVINAATINVNGTINIGRVTDYNITFSAQNKAALDTYRTFARLGGQRVYDISNMLAPSLQKLVSASFDAISGQISLSDINAYAGGGSIYMSGAIINTNPTGCGINVNGGYGHVAINNATGYGLNLAGINTGNSAVAKVGVATVTLKNTLIQDSSRNTTTYVYRPNDGVYRYITANGARPAEGAFGERVGANGATYSTVAGARYEWMTQALLEREVSHPSNGASGYPSWKFSGNDTQNPWSYVRPGSASYNNGIGSSNYTSIDLTKDPVGQVVHRPDLAGVQFRQEIDGDITGFFRAITYEYEAQNARGFAKEPNQNYALYTYVYANRAYLRMLMSVKADNAINLGFSGFESGAVSINSNGAVVLGGNIINTSGATTITTTGASSNITQSGNAAIQTASLVLNAGGTIGSDARALQVSILGTRNPDKSAVAGSDTLSSTAGGSINLALDSGATIVQIAAGNGANVTIAARDSLGAGTAPTGGSNPGVHVVGRSITLASAAGSVGSTAKPLVVASRSTGTDDSGLLVRAQGDIGLLQTGDLRVKQVVSNTGDITLTVRNGNLYDAAGQVSSKAISADQVIAVSKTLRLTQADGADRAVTETVDGFARLVNRTLSDYDALVRNSVARSKDLVQHDETALALLKALGQASKISGARAAADGRQGYTDLTDAENRTYADSLDLGRGGFRLSAAGIELYRAQAAAEIGRPASSLNGSEIQAWANGKYLSYAGIFTKAFGADWSNSVDAANRSAFTIVNGGALYTQLARDAVWTPTQLLQAVDRSALQPSRGDVGANATPNFVGRNLTITVDGNVGVLATPVAISLADLTNPNTPLPTDKLAALATATSPGSITLTGRKADGSALADGTTLSSLTGGETIEGIKVRQINPLYLSASGKITLSSGGVAYLHGTGASSIIINQVQANGAVTIEAPNAILRAAGTDDQPQIRTSGDINLTAGSGSIGAAGPGGTLVYQTSGTLNSVSAGTDVYLATPDAMRLGRVFAGGTASLSSIGGSITGTLPGITVAATSIVLDAQTNVGTRDAAFQLQVGATGKLTGTARTGFASIYAPNPIGQTGVGLQMGTFTAQGDLIVRADNALSIDGVLTAGTGNADINADSLKMTIGSQVQAARNIDALVRGDAVLGRLASTYDASLPAETIRVTATSGSILSAGVTGPAAVNFDAGSGRSGVTLNAGTAIGARSQPVYVRAARLTGLATGGDIVLTARSTLYSPSLMAGSLTRVNADLGSVTIDQVNTRGAVINAGTDIKGNTLSSVAADVTLTGGSLATGTTGQIDWRTITAGGQFSTTWSGVFNAGTLTGRGVLVEAKGPVTVATLNSSDITRVTTDASATITNGTSLRRMQVNGLNGIRFGSLMTTDATGDIELTSTDGSVEGATIRSQRNTTILAKGIAITSSLTAMNTGKVTLTSTAGIRGNQLSADAATLRAPGAITWGDFSVRNLGDIASADDLVSFTSLRTGDSLVSADKSMTIGILAATRSARVQSQRGNLDITRQALSVGTSLTTKSGGTTKLAAININGSVSLTSGGTMTLNSVRAGGTLDVTSSGSLSLTQATATGSAGLNATGNLTFDQVTTTGIGSTVTLGATGGALNGRQVTAAGDANLSGETISVRDGFTSGGDLTAIADGTLTLGRTNARGNITTRSGGTQTLKAVTSSTGFVQINSRGGLSATDVNAKTKASVVNVGGGNVGLTTVSAADVWLGTDNGITVDRVTARNSARLIGNQIVIKTLQQSSDATAGLLLDIEGPVQAVAASASVNVQTARGVSVGSVKVRDLRMTVNGQPR